MGIKGLFPFLKRWEEDVSLEILMDKSVGLDIFWFLHQSKGNMAVLEELLQPYLANAREVCAVFDGTPSVSRQQELAERREKREEQQSTIDVVEQVMSDSYPVLEEPQKRVLQRYLQQLKRQVWAPSPEYVQQVSEWLREKGAIIHVAEEEADTLLVDLERTGQIQIIVSNDSDLLTWGARSLLRPYGDRGKWLYRDHLLRNMELTHEQWMNFMYLCRYKKNPDFLQAYSLVRVYSDMDQMIEYYEV